MARKFQDNQEVILSNPRTNHNKLYTNEVFTVLRYDARNSSAPYRITNGRRTLVVRADEISFNSATVNTTSENDTEELNTSEFPKPTEKPTRVKRIEYGQIFLKESGMKVGDKVRVDFIPNKSQCQSFGLHSDISGYMHSDRHKQYKKEYEGQEAYITNTGYSSRDYVTAHVEKGKGSVPMPIFGLTVIQHGLEVATFRASSARDVTVFTTGVYVDNDDIRYSFEFFENLWKLIKEHMKNNKSGSDREIKLSEGPYEKGILRDNYIKVGCQEFYYDNVKRLMAAIRVARSVS